MNMSDICCVVESLPIATHQVELARLTSVFTEQGLAKVPLIDLRRVLQLEGVRLAALDLSQAEQAALPLLSRQAYGEICRRLLA